MARSPRATYLLFAAHLGRMRLAARQVMMQVATMAIDPVLDARADLPHLGTFRRFRPTSERTRGNASGQNGSQK